LRRKTVKGYDVPIFCPFREFCSYRRRPGECRRCLLFLRISGNRDWKDLARRDWT
jgi:hypothetical protein